MKNLTSQNPEQLFVAQVLINKVKSKCCGIKEDMNTRKREVAALVALNKVYPIRKAIIITYDEEEIIEEDGVTIEVIPIWKWLISPEK